MPASHPIPPPERRWSEYPADMQRAAAAGDVAAMTAADGRARRRDSALCRWSYATGGLIIAANVIVLIFGGVDWAAALASLTLAAVLVKAGIDHGRLW